MVDGGMKEGVNSQRGKKVIKQLYSTNGDAKLKNVPSSVTDFSVRKLVFCFTNRSFPTSILEIRTGQLPQCWTSKKINNLVV